MLSHPAAEFDILARARWLATALASKTNIDADQIIGNLDQMLAEAAPEPDNMTWFAMERISRNSGLKAVKFIQPGQDISGASMVWVSPYLNPSDEDAQRLSQLPLVVANDAWQQAIARAGPQKKRSNTP